MTVCKFCGFDSEADSLVAEGAPCGIDGCSMLICCHEQWLIHKNTHHKRRNKNDTSICNE